MAAETHTGTLIFSEGQVALDDGTLLAIQGPSPCATAAARLARWGQTQPVTVTGTPGLVDNSPVLFVDSVQWAAPVLTPNIGAVEASLDHRASTAFTTAPVPIAPPPPAKKASKKNNKSAAPRLARSRSSK